MNSYNFEEKKIFSFDKNFSYKIFFTEPDKYKLLEEVSRKSEKIINIGSNLSYSPLGFGKSSVSINIRKFNRVLELDKNKKTITIEGGATLIDLLNITLKNNLWIPQLPGYPSITIGGAVAANSHGKSCATHGTIRKSIKNILLFHKINGWMNLSESENKEIFDLTIGGLGLTGTIVNVTFSLSEIESTQFITTKKYVNSINDCKKIITQGKEKSSFIYSWHRADNIKNFGKGFVFMNNTDKNILSKHFELRDKKYKLKPTFFPIWNNFSIKTINFLFYLLHKFNKAKKKENFIKVIFPFYGKESYFNFFGKKGFLESQLLINSSKIDEFIEEFKKLYKIYKPTITLFSLKNMSGEQTYLRFEDNKICITFDYINNSSSLLFMKEIDKLYSKYAILPSIIKDSRLSKEVFINTYQHALDFKNKLSIFDKNRVYKSEVSKRLDI